LSDDVIEGQNAGGDMSKRDDPFELLVNTGEIDEFEALILKPLRPESPAATPSNAATARLHGFDLDDQPLVVGLSGLPKEIVPARTTIPLLRAHIGCSVVVVFDQGDVRRPIIVGVLQDSRPSGQAALDRPPLLAVDVDDERLVLSAEREIILRCGEASITLTRAGRVIIRGTYIMSRSSGYNKIKGAAVDIN